ncbi:hypothetical protein EAG18_03955 [Pseudoalteromonas sp. J010]|uniref:hypothetical protein n=1 Tax=Pseudoalteromonas sp. J010 TaxID=998465 RepID=UPI000F64A103|nr:hypothetical protein [Pseudoalteromonas sp. J010]RRS10093.1 hypothetical protein EAG18_03955 [Pseudoalteromonas sp. J010]
MFKKSLLALALVGASTSALAVNTTVANSINVSVEGQAADAAATTSESAEVTLNLNAEYTVGDTVTLTLSSGAEFADTQGYNLVGSSNVTFGLLNATKNELTFRVTARTDNTVTTGQTVQLKDALLNGNNITFKLADLADKQKITLAVVAKTSTGITLDTATGTNTDSAELFVGAKQFEVIPTASNGTVDVAQLRKGFVKQGTTEQVPAPSFTFADKSGTGSWISTISDDGFELKLTGDFTGVSEVNVGTAATDKFTIKDGTATLSGTSALSGETINFVLPADDKRVALTAPQSFKLTATVKEGTTKSAVVLDSSTVSTWSLNGDSEFVEIMPFSDTYNRYIAVTNNGTVEGDIMVELYSDGKMIAAKTVGTAGKYAVTNVTAAVDALAAENEVTGVAGVRVTTNAPEANIEVSAIYYNKDVQDHVKVN